MTPMNGSSFGRTGGLLRRQPGGTENFNIFETVLGSIPERRAAGARDSARLRWAFCEGECCGLGTAARRCADEDHLSGGPSASSPGAAPLIDLMVERGLPRRTEAFPLTSRNRVHPFLYTARKI